MENLSIMTEKELLDMFDSFLLKVDFRIEHLKYATKNDGYVWDYSIASLNSLEKLILEKNINENHDLFDDIASYIGEVVCKTYGGKWECCLDKKNSLFYGLPVISNFNKFGVLLSPYSLLKIFIQRKKEGQIAHAIEICVNPPEFDF